MVPPGAGAWAWASSCWVPMGLDGLPMDRQSGKAHRRGCAAPIPGARSGTGSGPALTFNLESLGKAQWTFDIQILKIKFPEFII